MKIKKIHLKEYKRFFDLTIDLGESPARIIALVGPNGCGKSCVFDSFLYMAHRYTQIGNTGNKDYKYHSLKQNSKYRYDNVSIIFDEGDFDTVFQNRQYVRLEKTVFSFRSSFRYNGNLDVRESKAVSELKENNYGASTASDIDQRIEQNYRRLKIKYDKYLNDNDARPSEARTHIIGELNSAIHNCLNIEIDNLGNIEAGQGTLFFRKNDSPEPFEFNVLSSGEKEIVDILLDLYLRRDEYTDSIYIIDEPELHLNTSIQRKLIFEINKMISEDCQIWIATHSIGFLRALQDELYSVSQIVEFKEENMWASQSYTLKPMTRTRASWQSVFKTALDDLTNLIAPKQLIYCEGRAEPAPGGGERGLDAAVYNTIFGETHPDTLFISSGGNTELDQRSNIAIAILSKVFPETDILVLKDLDMASGNMVTEESRRIYLENNPDNHRVLKRFEIENYLYDKEVIKKYCANNNLVFDEEGYDDLVSDIVFQHVKDETNIIKKICGIKFSITPDNFKKQLAKCIDSTMEVYSELEQVIFNQI